MTRRSNACRALLALLALAAPGAPARAVGGISGAKLSAPNTATVPRGNMEVEPYFGLAYSTQEYNGRAQVVSTGFRDQSYETGFRFTAGITPRLEAGLVLPIRFSRSMNRASDEELGGAGIGDLPVGLKWRMFQATRVSLAVAAGVTFPTGDARGGAQKVPLGDGVYTPELGLIATFEVYKGLSIDVHLGWGTSFAPEGDVSAMGGALDVAVGYAFGPFQPVIELAQSVSGWDGTLGYSLALLGGFTWEINPKVIMVTGVRVPLVGRRTPRELGYSLAFTLLL